MNKREIAIVIIIIIIGIVMISGCTSKGLGGADTSRKHIGVGIPEYSIAQENIIIELGILESKRIYPQMMLNSIK